MDIFSILKSFKLAFTFQRNRITWILKPLSMDGLKFRIKEFPIVLVEQLYIFEHNGYFD